MTIWPAGCKKRTITASKKRKEPRSSGSFDAVACCAQGGPGHAKILVLHEQIIRVECRNGKDADSLFGEREHQRSQDADNRELDGPRHPQAPPVLFTVDPFWDTALRTEDREFVSGAGDRRKDSIKRPGRDRVARVQPAYGKEVRQNKERQMSHHSCRLSPCVSSVC